jgi:hypothetical protein
MMKKVTLTVCIQASVPDDLDSAELCLDMQPTDFRLDTVTGADVEGEILDFCTENVEYTPEQP